jgi:hypothetical protein
MKSFLVNMDDGSQRLIRTDNLDYDGDLVLGYIRSKDLFTAVMCIRDRYPCPRIVLAEIECSSSAAIIYPTGDENNSVLLMEVPLSAGRFLTIDAHDAHFVIDKLIWPSTTSVIFTEFTELEYTFM